MGSNNNKEKLLIKGIRKSAHIYSMLFIFSLLKTLYFLSAISNDNNVVIGENISNVIYSRPL